MYIKKRLNLLIEKNDAAGIFGKKTELLASPGKNEKLRFFVENFFSFLKNGQKIFVHFSEPIRLFNSKLFYISIFYYQSIIL